MFRLKDILLILVLFSSLLVGILFPEFGSPFRPYIIYFMMSILFLSLLPIELAAVRQTISHHYGIIAFLTLLKMLILPVIIYFLFLFFYPSYAMAALLMTGISTGVTAPFISSHVNADHSLVLVMVVITSLLVPFTLPLLVKTLAGRETALSLWSMIRMLGMAIFVPILALETLRRVSPSLIGKLMKAQFPLSLALFAVINFGVFSQYSVFFRQEPFMVLVAMLVAMALGALYLFAGLLTLRGRPIEKRLAAVITVGNINNVLIIVFASQFFGPLETTVATMYVVPFFGLILPLRADGRMQAERNHVRKLNGPGKSPQ